MSTQNISCPVCNSCLTVEYQGDCVIFNVFPCQPAPEPEPTPPATISKRMTLSGPIDPTLPSPAAGIMLVNGGQVGQWRDFVSTAPSAWHVGVEEDLRAIVSDSITVTQESDTSYLFSGLPEGTDLGIETQNAKSPAGSIQTDILVEGNGVDQSAVVQFTLLDQPIEGTWRIDALCNPVPFDAGDQEIHDAMDIVLQRPFVVSFPAPFVVRLDFTDFDPYTPTAQNVDLRKETVFSFEDA